ncbi:hypothetical protein CR513_02411, partial [Mucuna pruriens]
MSDSLVRVSRRAEWGAHKMMLGAHRCQGMPRRHDEHFDSPGLGHHPNPRRSMSRVDRRTGFHRSTSNRDISLAPIHFPSTISKNKVEK